LSKVQILALCQYTVVYKIIFAKRAQRALLRMPKNTAVLVRQKLEQLAVDPYAPNFNAMKLQNRSGYRLRIGDWRVIYEIRNDELVILVTWRSLPMNGTVQVIERDGKPEWAVLPYDVYVQLVEDAEMLQDIRDYDAVKTAIEQGKEELSPSEVTFALLDGENPIKVWREYRGMTQQQLAEKVEISTPYLSQLETGKRTGKPKILLAIARALEVTLDELVTQSDK
jgi:mRNA-degrading endonuclease RelE of RelBE toxin-antitoxin system/DNA-binding XRE family transcriptional regulator